MSINRNITCPSCNVSFELTEALRGQLTQELETEIKIKIEKEKEEAIKDINNELNETKLKLKEMAKEELALRDKARQLESDKENFELTLARKIDEERAKIAMDVSEKYKTEFRLRELEKDKKISDLMDALEAAQKKALQGSQQLQGEVLELDLETTLIENFPSDLITPVAKGIKGADIAQTVKSPMGNGCGVILWEIKRTKAWNDEWVLKLKDDLRSSKADIPVIVTTTFPKGIVGHMGQYEGVWVVSAALVVPLATLLRKSLLDVARQKAITQSKSDRASMLYDYITGVEFRSQIEAMVEAYTQMRDDLSRERIAFEKIWKTRESQLNRLMQSTVGIYGGVQGLVGNQMAQIKGVDLLTEG